MTEYPNLPPHGYAPPPGWVPAPPPPYSVGAAITWAWYTFRKNWKVFVAGMILPVLVMLAYYAFFIALYVPFFTDSYITDDELVAFVKKMLVLTGAYFVASIPMILLYANLMRAALVAADGGTPTYRMLVSTKRAGYIFLTSLALGIGYLVGTVLCYLPGLAFGAFAIFTLPFVLDKGLSVFAAIKASFALVRANLGLVLLTLLAVAGISYAGSMALIVGMAVSVPVGMLILVYAYRSLVPATPTQP